MPIWHGRTQSTEGFDAKTDEKTRPDAPLFHHFRTPLRTQSYRRIDAKTDQKTARGPQLFTPSLRTGKADIDHFLTCETFSFDSAAKRQGCSEFDQRHENDGVNRNTCVFSKGSRCIRNTYRGLQLPVPPVPGLMCGHGSFFGRAKVG